MQMDYASFRISKFNDSNNSTRKKNIISSVSYERKPVFCAIKTQYLESINEML